MKILSANQIREIDAYTIENEPVSSIDLMERAALACANWISTNYPGQRSFKVMAGPGNNGGDGLAIARILINRGFKVKVFLIQPIEKLSADAQVNFKRLSSIDKNCIKFLEEPDLPEVAPEDVIIDALFGSGLTRPLTSYPAKLVHHLNASGAQTVAIDIPSGLFCDTNENNSFDAIIQAKHTLTFELPKLAFFFSENDQYVGEWHIMPINLHPQGINLRSSDIFLQTVSDLSPFLMSRRRFSHKGTYGHGLLVAGSYGKIGAAVLASRACLKSGVGLLTTHLPKCGYEIMQVASPETMVSMDEHAEMVTHVADLENYSAIGIGPGLGKSFETIDALRNILTKANVPLVLDADALNMLAANQWLLDLLPNNSILTPHPKEFDRLAGKFKTANQRYRAQLDFSKDFKVIVVLKGAYTCITTPDGISWFNSSGNPGMATAGSGDVLTGIILSLLAQGYDPVIAARLGVMVHGLAGDLALEENSMESIVADDIINYLGKAFNKLRST